MPEVDGEEVIVLNLIYVFTWTEQEDKEISYRMFDTEGRNGSEQNVVD